MTIISAPNLTTRQQELLEAIQQLTAQKGYVPSFREMGRAIQVSSTGVIAFNICALVRKGYINREPGVRRAIYVLPAKGEKTA